MTAYRSTLILSAIALGLASAVTAQPPADVDWQMRLALAKQYANVTHRESKLADLARRQLSLTLQVCHDAACQSKLDDILTTTTRKAASDYTQEFAVFMANHYTAEEMRASISFYSSPVGQKIISTQDGDNDDLVKIYHDFYGRVKEDLYNELCKPTRKNCEKLAPITQSKPSP